MVVQAYFDDSYSPNGVHVLAGYMARAECWAGFSREWGELLPRAFLGNSGRFRFKMNEMAHRMDDVPGFYKVISRHLPYSITIALREQDFSNARGRVWSDNSTIIWGPQDNINNSLYLFLVNYLFDACWQHDGIRKWLGYDEKIDIYLDNNVATKWVLEDWDEWVSGMPEHFRHFAGNAPTLVDDEEFLPMQAADFWAWWVRKGYEEGSIDDIFSGNFGTWLGDRIPGVSMLMNEDDITNTLISRLKRSPSVLPWDNIYDDRKTPRNKGEMPIREFAKKQNFISYIEQSLSFIRRRLGS